MVPRSIRPLVGWAFAGTLMFAFLTYFDGQRDATLDYLSSTSAGTPPASQLLQVSAPAAAGGEVSAGYAMKTAMGAPSVEELAAAIPPNTETVASSLQEAEDANHGALRGFVKDVFDRIYARKSWGAYGKGSGLGSTITSTVVTREVLLQVIRQHKITSMADVPCGAMAWMPTLLNKLAIEVPGFRYFGGDIVEGVIQDNTARFSGKRPNWVFQVFDMTSQTIPPGYELIHCRDALQHLPLDLVVEALRRFSQSQARLLVLGSYDPQDGAKNQKVAAGGYFSIDLRAEPFGLDRPLAVHNEETSRRAFGVPDKYMLVYDMEDLRAMDFDAMAQRVAEFRRRYRLR